MEVKMDLNNEYKFINFDTNKGNKLAYTLSLAVAEQLGKKYSPLFISGNEKERTHLMSAIANYVIELFNYKVLYVNATEINKIPNNIDVLLIDELEHLSSEEESKLIEIIKTFQSNKKQIVLGSNKMLDELNISNNLKEVINWGMSVNIEQNNNKPKKKNLFDYNWLEDNDE